MADTRRIVTMSDGGRPVEQINLEVSGTYQAIQDTFAYTPGERNQQTSREPGRYGGTQVVGEQGDNGTVSWQAVVRGGTYDQVAANVETLLAQIENAGRDRRLEWRPDGTTYSSYFRLAGPGTWKPTYKWTQFQGAMSMVVELSWPTRPLVLWDPMTIGDDFSVDTLDEDYTWQAGHVGYAVSGGAIVATSTAIKRALHTGRGYQYQDAQATLKIHIGSALGNFQQLLAGRSTIDFENRLAAFITHTGNLHVSRYLNGTFGDLVSVASCDLTLNSDRWLRLRAEGDLVTAEWWTTEPTPGGTPQKTVSYTLTASEQVLRGVEGYWGPGEFEAGAADGSWTYDDFTVEPYTYAGRTLPDRIALGGDIPGAAPALVDVEVASATRATWGLIAWTGRRTNDGPVGVFDSDDASASAAETSGTWADIADAAALGGTYHGVTAFASGAASIVARWDAGGFLLDVQADEFAEGIVDLEMWARLRISAGLVNPRARISYAPFSALSSTESEAFTHEYGSDHKALVVPASGGDVWRFVRLGVLTMDAEQAASSQAEFRLSLEVDATSSGHFGYDYLFAVPARRRAAGATGVADDDYPAFLPIISGGDSRKTVRSDLSGHLVVDTNTVGVLAASHHGLGGSLIHIDPGPTDLLVKLSTLVPDDPTVDLNTETVTHTARVRLDVTPRSYLLRGQE